MTSTTSKCPITRRKRSLKNIPLLADALVLLRFGNYIGGAGESEGGSQSGDVRAEIYTHDMESEGEEGADLINDQQFMEIDGDDLRAIAPRIFLALGTDCQG